MTWPTPHLNDPTGRTGPTRPTRLPRLTLWLATALLAIPAPAQCADSAKWAERRAGLEQRPKKIFAHYMGCFPIGAKGVSPGYARSKAPGVRHDSPNFELAFGGRVRGMPLLPDGIDGLSLEESADLEIRRALRAGIDGFAFMAIAGGPENVFPVMDAMFKVAEGKDYPFEITWCLSNLDRSLQAIEYILERHGDSPKLARRDGKVLMLGYQSVFGGIPGARRIFAERHPEIVVDSPEERASPEFLRLLREGYRDLERRFETPMYFQFGFGALFYGMQGRPAEPMGWPEIMGLLAEEFEAVTAFHVQSGPEDYDAVARAVTAKGAEWGEPLMYQYENLLWQGYRAGSFPLVPGSDAIRERWERARENHSTLIQFTTWNDYHEATSLAPTTDTRYGLMDLTAYFVQWWKTGLPPKPERDKIYLLYPKYPHELSAYPFGNRGVWQDTERMNRLEVLTILTAPAQVRLPGRNEVWNAPAGLFWRQVPLTPGPVVAELVRRKWHGRRYVVTRLESPEPVTDKPYREQHSMVCVSTEDVRHWQADFGATDPAPLQRGEYGDVDGDGLPNWFEMYWFGKHLMDWEAAATADPAADPDGDGMSNLDEWQARRNPTLKSDYSAGHVWNLHQATEESAAAFNPEHDSFDTPVWYFMHKYSPEFPVEHGGYWLCERFGWYPQRLQAVYAPPYNTPDPAKPAGQFMRQWETEGRRASGESMPLVPSRYQVAVGPYGLQALGWRSPIGGMVRLAAKLSPLAGDQGVYQPATITVEREGRAEALATRQFNPHDGVDLETAAIEVKPGDMLYLVLDAAPGRNRNFTLALDRVAVTVLANQETQP